MKGTDSKAVNTTALAFLGDAVYEVAVRRHLLDTGQANADQLHRMAVGFVRAEGQAAALKLLMGELTADEQALVRRARNKKITSKPKNADPVTYKLATAFESLVGWLYVSGEEARLRRLVTRAIQVTAEAGPRQAGQKERGKHE